MEPKNVRGTNKVKKERKGGGGGGGEEEEDEEKKRKEIKQQNESLEKMGKSVEGQRVR